MLIAKKILNVVMKIYLVTSIVLIIITMIFAGIAINKGNNSELTMGKIVDFTEKITEEKTIISPIIEYTVDGKEYTYTGNYYSSNMKEGDQIELLYNEETPQKVTMKGSLRIVPIVTGGLSVFFGVGCVIIIFIIKKFLKEKN